MTLEVVKLVEPTLEELKAELEHLRDQVAILTDELQRQFLLGRMIELTEARSAWTLALIRYGGKNVAPVFGRLIRQRWHGARQRMIDLFGDDRDVPFEAVFKTGEGN